MKKVGIVTLNGYFNYGNRLQNYALQEAIKTLGYDVETLVFDYERYMANENHPRTKDIEKNKTLLIKIKVLISKFFFQTRKCSNKIRTKYFRDFSKQYIKESEVVLKSESQLKVLDNQYDYFVVGSDQVWSPWYTELIPYYYLQFAKPEKRISYAASFGVSTIPDQLKVKQTELLKGLEYYSVREDAGKTIVKDLVNREASVHVDPTLLLDAKEWEAVEKQPLNFTEKKYLLTYFLGGVPKEYESKINEIAQKYDLEIISLGDKDNKETYRNGPSEFLYYINHSSFMCTDSFHGTVYSIIFNVPFIAFERIGSANMFSRISTLLSTFNFDDRADTKIDYTKDLLDIDFSQVDSVLIEQKTRSQEYLKDAFNTSE